MATTTTILEFGDVTGYRLGFSPVGSPLMEVIFYHVDCFLVDTGQSHMRSAACRLVEDKRVAMVLLTHYHEDHSGNASAFSEKRSVPVYAHPGAGEKLANGFRIRPYQHYMWGRAGIVDTVAFPGILEGEKVRLEPVHAPGHSRDHTVFHERSRGWLFSGDLYIGDRIKYFRADENIYETIESLGRVMALDFDTLFCGHRPRLSGGKEALARKRQYLEDIVGEVEALLGKGLPGKTVVKRLSRDESHFVKLITLGNVSLANMVRSAVRDR